MEVVLEDSSCVSLILGLISFGFRNHVGIFLGKSSLNIKFLNYDQTDGDGYSS